MFFSRFTILSLLALSSSALARPADAAGAGVDVARRSGEAVVGEWASLEKRDVDSLDHEELERRAISGLIDDLHALEERSTSSVTIEKRCHTCDEAAKGKGKGKGGDSVGFNAHVELKTAFETCTKKVKTCGKKIKQGVKKCGSRPSAVTVVAAVKGELGELRAAISALAQVCLKIQAHGKGSLTVTIVKPFIINLLVAVHAALLDIISLVASVPLLVVFLACELLAISAQLVIAVNALFSLLGWELKSAVSASLSANLFIGFQTLGCWSLVSVIQI